LKKLELIFLLIPMRKKQTWPYVNCWRRAMYLHFLSSISHSFLYGQFLYKQRNNLKQKKKNYLHGLFGSPVLHEWPDGLPFRIINRMLSFSNSCSPFKVLVAMTSWELEAVNNNTRRKTTCSWAMLISNLTIFVLSCLR
jgi:hypothetical protein